MRANWCTDVCPITIYSALSEVVNLLVGVVVGGLEKHLRGVAGIFVLVHHLNAIVEPVDIDLLVADSAVLHLLLLQFVFLLEVALRLKVAV